MLRVTLFTLALVAALAVSPAVAVNNQEGWWHRTPIHRAWHSLTHRPACNKRLGREYPPAGEREAIDTIKTMIPPQQAADKETGGKALRFFHAKAHGCVDAKFVVNKNIKTVYQQGIFVPGKSYPARIRFSNGFGEIKPDSAPDTRGFAMKVLGVKGKKIMADDFGSQDFVTAVFPNFFFPSAAAMAEGLTLIGAKGLWGKVKGGAKLVWKYPKTAAALAKTLWAGKKVKNPFAATYHSQTPYALGPNNAVKYKITPCNSQAEFTTSAEGDNSMRANAKQTLESKQCFSFQVQLQADACRDSLENSMIEWSSKYEEIARIWVPAQKFDYPDKNEQCENLHISPWHSLEAHRPLGINRIRREIYEFSSANRHKLNNADVYIPTPKEVQLASVKTGTPARRGPPAGSFLETDDQYEKQASFPEPY